MTDPDRPDTYHDVRDDYDDDFGQALSPREIARRRLFVPAVAFLLIGVLGILGMVAVAIGVVVEHFRLNKPESHWVAVVVYIAFTFVGWVWFGLVIAGGFCLLRLERYRLALVAAYIVTGLSVVGCYAILFFPFGIWALILLYRPDVREEFRRPARVDP